MILLNLRNFLIGLLDWKERKDDQFKRVPELSEHKRLLHRLNCLRLDDDEAKSLQAHLTTILEARHQAQSSDSACTQEPPCIVLEMNDEEYREFTNHVKENGSHLFRALVKKDSNQKQTRELVIVGQHGLHLFHLRLQSA